MTKFAMIFPGQGSQSVGMFSTLSTQYPEVQAAFMEASDVLGYDLWKRVSEGPAEELNKTWQTQPALLCSSVAIYRIWQARHGNKPDLMAGHSLGEYSALVCSGVIAFTDAVRLVELRGRLMQEAVPEGTGSMYAIIGLDNESIETACKENAGEGIVASVNFNSPGQTVIAGNKAAVERAAEACKKAGAKRALPLPVSVPSHCALMKPAAEKLAKALENIPFLNPQVPVLNNVNAIAETDPAMIKQALIEQLYSPVRWTEIVQRIADQKITLLLEMGPGKVLTGLTKRISESLTSMAVNDPESLDAALDATKTYRDKKEIE